VKTDSSFSVSVRFAADAESRAAAAVATDSDIA